MNYEFSLALKDGSIWDIRFDSDKLIRKENIFATKSWSIASDKVPVGAMLRAFDQQ